MRKFSKPRAAQKEVFYAIFMALSWGLMFLALLAPRLAELDNGALQVGDVAAREILAPYTLSYESAILTERQREAAKVAVAPVFTAPDTSIARTQRERLRAALDFITNIRLDAFATPQQKLADISQIKDAEISQETLQAILILNDVRWEVVQQETMRVLEQVMRTTIRDDRLEEARRGIPALVDLSLPEPQANIVVGLAAAFTVPNSFYSEESTRAAQAAAVNQVKPVVQTYVGDQTIVQRGQVVSATAMEALQQFDMVEPQDLPQEIGSAALLSLVLVIFFFVYFRRSHIFQNDLLGLTTVTSLFFIFLFGARLTLPGHTVLPYLFPAMAFSLTIAVLFRPEVGLVSSLPLAILITYRMPNALELTLYFVMGSLFGVLTLRRAQRLSSFLRSGLFMSFSGAALLLAMRITDANTDWIGLLTLMGAGFITGITSIFVTLLLQLMGAQFLGLSTPLQLIELSRPDHPLLQFMLRNAPGSYQHSLQVANLAEQAAERIGADALLTRVGALYHDVGKALNPLFFIENQVPGSANPHDDLDFVLSAMTIIRHVPDGLELAQKYRLPTAIRNFISEHHGTMLTNYQYVKAVEAAGGDESLVDKVQFRYPGPKPRSRETALLMLADACEARLRAGRPKNDEQIRTMIQEVIDGRIKTGELQDTQLTLQELAKVADSFAETLRGVYHPRIEYPTLPPKPAVQILPEAAPETQPVANKEAAP